MKLLAKNCGSAVNKLILGKPNTVLVQLTHKIPRSSLENVLNTNCKIARKEKRIEA